MTETRNEQKRPIISLFSGAMGLDLGIEAAGLDIVIALECKSFPIATIERNRPSLPLIDRPIEDVASEEILEAAQLTPGEAFAVVGGPSCQVFSTAGHRQSLGDPRSTMFQHFVRVVRDTQPEFFVMENVQGLLSAAVRHRPLKQRGPGYPRLAEEELLGSAFRVVAETLRNLGYYCVFDVLNAADYGVPQTRQRLVVIGSRDGRTVRMPEPTHDSEGARGLPRWRTLGEALEGVNEDDPDYYPFCPAKERYLKLVPEGGNWRQLPEDLKSDALGSAFRSWGGRSGFFRRLSRERPCPALTTRPDSKATTLCHPTELRPLTVGEYARVQQFPDDWIFEGPVRKKYEQVGNAVPIGLGAAIGTTLIAASRSCVSEDRLGRFETFNLDLLGKLTRRPKTILNPPRMRQDDEQNTIAAWHGDSQRLREDAHDYVPAELAKEFERLIAQSPRRARRYGRVTSHTADETEASETQRRTPEGALQLAVAE